MYKPYKRSILVSFLVLVIFLGVGVFGEPIFAVVGYGQGGYYSYEYQCEPCPGHLRYDCTASCNGELKDIWCEPCCSGACWVQSITPCGNAQKCNGSDGTCDCSADKCYPPPEPRELKNQTLVPKNVFEDPDRDLSLIHI